MSAFNPDSFGPAVAKLLIGVPPAPLDAGIPRKEARKAIEALNESNLFDSVRKPLRDPQMARACISALWLRHNFLEESHAISQAIETPTGSFWHAILHRREPDFGNARYWLHRVGAHPAIFTMTQAAKESGWEAPWTPFIFVERVEKALRSKTESDSIKLCATIQQREWEILFNYCWCAATGENQT